MKLDVFVIALFAMLFFVMPLGAQSRAVDDISDAELTALTGDIVRYVQLDIMAERGEFLNDDGVLTMQRYSEALAPEYRDILFDQHRKEPISAAAVNAFTGGIGSLLMGDYLVGTVVQVGTLAGYTFAILGIITQDPTMRSTFSMTGAITGGVAAVVGIALPFLSASIHNGRLRDALRM